MLFLQKSIAWLLPDKRSEWEQKRELEFIEAANKLKYISVCDWPRSEYRNMRKTE